VRKVIEQGGGGDQKLTNKQKKKRGNGKGGVRGRSRVKGEKNKTDEEKVILVRGGRGDRVKKSEGKNIVGKLVIPAGTSKTG